MKLKYKEGVDPLTGEDYTETPGVDYPPVPWDPVLSILRQISANIRTTHPTMKCSIRSIDNTIPAADSRSFKFEISAKAIPALALLIQNNTAAAIYVGLDTPANAGSFQIAANSSMQIANVCVYTLSIYNSGVTILPVTGIINQSSSSENGVVIQGWSNPEWSTAWGAI